MKNNYKKIAVLVAVMILTLSLASTGFAANTIETLKAYYRNITIYKNGTQANFSHEPFIVDGTTYVPVRDMSELLGKTVTFNPQTYRIDITDAPDANLITMQTKLVQQEITIKNLEDKVKNLEAELAAKQSSKPSNATISEMQKYLNSEYGTDSDVDFEITLSGSKSKIELGIYVDDKTSSNKFGKWTSSDKKSFAEELVDEILDEFTSAKISGFYKDDYAKTSKQSFSVSSSGKVTMGSSSSSDYDLYDLEDELYAEFKGYYGITDIDVSGDEDDIDVYVYVDYYDWDYLTPSEIRTMKGEIIDFIEEEFPWASIYGEVIDDIDDDELDYFQN